MDAKPVINKWIRKVQDQEKEAIQRSLQEGKGKAALVFFRTRHNPGHSLLSSAAPSEEGEASDLTM
ncbi:hypothetical protein [Legionella cardiaca]|uniref:Uncharacterized protein n=1 Tax=Legionella cardiaca TaxID=1071983 RepID=A0ABY8AN68_9GAMM|nr:hypothetical protein [Legionella cardiaca]WED42008.1 hypothetical protein PXX05_08675 [Legionella cardiaca]